MHWNCRQRYASWRHCHWLSGTACWSRDEDTGHLWSWNTDQGSMQDSYFTTRLSTAESVKYNTTCRHFHAGDIGNGWVVRPKVEDWLSCNYSVRCRPSLPKTCTGETLTCILITLGELARTFLCCHFHIQ